MIAIRKRPAAAGLSIKNVLKVFPPVTDASIQKKYCGYQSLSC